MKTHLLATSLLGAILVLGCREMGAEKRIDHKAPVENPAAKPAMVVDQADEPKADWTEMPAWYNGSTLAQNGYQITPAGQMLGVSGRVMSLALARGGQFLIAKTDSRLAVIDAERFQVIQQVEFPEKKDGGSMHGLTVSPDGATLYFTGKSRNLYTAAIDAQGTLTFGPPIDLAVNQKTSNPLGIALSPDGKTAVVALAVANEVAVVDLVAGKAKTFIPVGVCPYGVAISPDGKTAFVSNFGGRRAVKGDKTEKSAGTDVVVDERSVALLGTVSIIDIARGKVAGEIVTRIHPEAMTLSPDGKLLYVVDASGDGITVIDVATRQTVHCLDTKPQADLPYGSLTNGLCFSPDGKILFAANAGNNAIALLNPAKPQDPPYALIAAGGFPGAVCMRGNELFIANVYGYKGDLQKVTVPQDPPALQALSLEAKKGFHLQDILRAQRQARPGIQAKPIPANPGEPSTIKHVVYIIKENKKYDPVFGDIGRGNSDPKLCEFPRATTPNLHAIADQFVLLDNYYCSGVLSCDGHQWAVQGLTSPYREKDWSNLHCNYDFGTDPLCYAGCGFIWDHIMRRGVSFRNFGEFDFPVKVKGKTWTDFHQSWKTKSGQAEFKCVYSIETLRRYSDLRFPGWEMDIPDQVRADAFLQALAEYEQAGSLPEFIVIYLPNDHTSGGSQTKPTPRAYVADNDLATGRVLEGLSKSPFWKDMAVFINEDDPQTGADHVDGHRSYCLVAGPYVKRGGSVVKRFYNQSSVLHTICRIFGAPPMNQTVAMAPVMDECFQDAPDFTPYACLPTNIPLDEMNPPPQQTKSKTQNRLAPKTAKLDFSRPDRIDNDAILLSRFVWATVRGDERFPIEFTGAHGKGLKDLGLRLDPNAQIEDDDD